jgi:hypothetical protein
MRILNIPRTLQEMATQVTILASTFYAFHENPLL